MHTYKSTNQMKKFLVNSVLILSIGFAVALLSQSAVLSQDDDYNYFPNESENAYLALTAEGDSVSMTYTPATYLFTKTKNESEYIEFQIQGAILEKSWEDFTENPSAKMTLAFETKNKSIDLIII